MREGRRLPHDILTLASHTSEHKTETNNPEDKHQDHSTLTRSSSVSTAVNTSTKAGGKGTQLTDLELRHRLRARCEDRIRVLKDLGLQNLPLHDFAQNQVWLETVLLAADLLTWTQTLGLTEHRRA